MDKSSRPLLFLSSIPFTQKSYVKRLLFYVSSILTIPRNIKKNVTDNRHFTFVFLLG